MKAFWILLAITIMLMLIATIIIYILAKQLKNLKAAASIDDKQKEASVLRAVLNEQNKTLNALNIEAESAEKILSNLQKKSAEEIKNAKALSLSDIAKEFKKLGY